MDEETEKAARTAAAQVMAKQSHARLNHLTETQRSMYFSLIRRGKKAEAKALLRVDK